MIYLIDVREKDELNKKYPITCYEIDQSINPIISFNKYQKVIYGDFLEGSNNLNLNC